MPCYPWDVGKEYKIHKNKFNTAAKIQDSLHLGEYIKSEATKLRTQNSSKLIKSVSELNKLQRSRRMKAAPSVMRSCRLYARLSRSHSRRRWVCYCTGVLISSYRFKDEESTHLLLLLTHERRKVCFTVGLQPNKCAGKQKLNPVVQLNMNKKDNSKRVGATSEGQ